MKVVRARTIDEATAALESSSDATRLLAGGTDLFVEIESGRTRPDVVVDVGRCAELRWIRECGAGVEIGAGTTCADLLRSSAVARHADLLVAAAREVGAVQIQNRATIGGNLATASPAADLVPVLFALGARVRLRSRRAERELAVEDFVTGYRATARRRDELIASVAIPIRPPGERRAFRKVGTRRAQSISKVVVALAVGPDGADARIAAGSVADRTVRLRALEAALAGAPLDRDAIERAVRDADRGSRVVRDAGWISRVVRDAGWISRVVHDATRLDVRPRDDVRSTAAYRLAVLERLLSRMLGDLLVPDTDPPRNSR